MEDYVNMTAEQVHAIECLTAMPSLRNTYRESLSALLRREWPKEWRMINMGIGLVDKAIQRIAQRMSAKNLRSFERMLNYGCIDVHYKGDARKNKDLVVLNKEDAIVICNAVLQDHCVLCIKTGKEVTGCRLRHAMWHVGVGPDWEKDGRCPYREHAMEGVS